MNDEDGAFKKFNVAFPGLIGRESELGGQIGGAIGSLVGRYLQVTPRERRVLLLAGVAAGMAGQMSYLTGRRAVVRRDVRNLPRAGVAMGAARREDAGR